ncbi:hypothetical protein Baya_10000 [Bagarius yarrelli]|uniref:Uncharacterized protein n=1 Tax=Bagarius yarrelli TaxID=175774 RepID=A0A556U867_BAGYA|nr:hypothetical protein Baya_10000 [Bagarius yarrelli]
MSRNTSKPRTEKGRMTSAYPPPPTQTEDLEDTVDPECLVKSECLTMIAHEEGEEIVAEILDELMTRVMKKCDEVYLKKQIIPFSVAWAKNAMLQLVNWHYLMRDEGDDIETISILQEDKTPAPLIPDSWAEGCVPVIKIPSPSQLQDGEGTTKLTLDECKPDSVFQQWQWNPETRFLRNPHTAKCLTALKIEDQGTVGSLACRAEDDAETQAWSCSKKGHLTLYGKGFHLSVHYDSSDVILSMERGKSAKWKTLNERTVCEEPPDEPKKMEPKIIAKIRLWQPQVNLDQNAPKSTPASDTPTVSPQSNSSTDDGDTRTFVNPLSLEYGLEWKVTMLVLSSVALIIGMVILFLSIYQNRRKKTVVVLKSYTATGEASQPGSPVPNERAPLTKYPMIPPRSPSIQRGEILVEWKDGSFESSVTTC